MREVAVGFGAYGCSGTARKTPGGKQSGVKQRSPIGQQPRLPTIPTVLLCLMFLDFMLRFELARRMRAWSAKY